MTSQWENDTLLNSDTNVKKKKKKTPHQSEKVVKWRRISRYRQGQICMTAVWQKIAAANQEAVLH